uniref:Uncharacterized protein n=1 Tax=Chromera velia CCMP2878 TaxID=1169474 RepID=A0A0G4GE72_9ALVE|eukprot:Cvel_21492.t1-p1 / transcript=Cvel_21492.t1 / gene=Cvel_21492 / organism=Chromera_velia_CCMP2878 / gene_product=hypothetical protein / transcript_product=hypothetical protein / location=Cvel_scaffold2020:14870-27885(+) / protein_length=171 / sequence_SO=supercontig / SO=protein_coding / is_pseudo=false
MKGYFPLELAPLFLGEGGGRVSGEGEFRGMSGGEGDGDEDRVGDGDSKSDASSSKEDFNFFRPPQTSLFLESWMTVASTVDGDEDSNTNTGGYDEKLHPDSCASHCLFCRDTVDSDRILWEVPIDLVMSTTDRNARGLGVGLYGAVQMIDRRWETGEIEDVDAIEYITKKG